MGPRKPDALDEVDLVAELRHTDGEDAARRTAAHDAHLRHDSPCQLRGLAQAQIGLEAVMQPAPDIVAGRSAAFDHFMVAAAATEKARPAAIAGLLTMYMPLAQPRRLPLNVNALIERAHGALLVIDKSMTGREVA